jgi:hypothetical protein
MESLHSKFPRRARRGYVQIKKKALLDPAAIPPARSLKFSTVICPTYGATHLQATNFEPLTDFNFCDKKCKYLIENEMFIACH